MTGSFGFYTLYDAVLSGSSFHCVYVCAQMTKIRKNTIVHFNILTAHFAAVRKKQRKKCLLPSKNRHYVRD